MGVDVNSEFQPVLWRNTCSASTSACPMLVHWIMLSIENHYFALLVIHVSVALTSVFLFWKVLVFDFLLGISQTVLCSMPALQVKVVILSDALQL
jgi:hypothetical protein